MRAGKASRATAAHGDPRNVEQVFGGQLDVSATSFPPEVKLETDESDNGLARDAVDEGGVTATRYFRRKLSPIRYGSSDELGNLGRSLDPSVCHHCREKFALDQLRYPILGDRRSDWGIVSLCKDCFEYDPDFGADYQYAKRGGREIADALSTVGADKRTDPEDDRV